MTRQVYALTGLVLAVALVVGCGRATEQPTADPNAGMEMPATGTVAGVEITFRSEPAPPRMRENEFEVAVRDAQGQPVTDADVSVEFYMAAMPQMDMPEMRNSIPLAHGSGGLYRGTGNVMMAGDWEVTVTATRNGEEIGRRTLKVTAQQ